MGSVHIACLSYGRHAWQARHALLSADGCISASIGLEFERCPPHAKCSHARRIDAAVTFHKWAACTLHVFRTGDMLGKLAMHCFQPMAAYPLQSASNSNDARLM